MTTLELLRRMEEAVTKQLDQVRREIAKTDPKEREHVERLRLEERVLQNAMVFANSSLLNAGLK